MTTADGGARTGEIEGRVVEWVDAALGSVETTDGVAVEASATRAASLPDDGLEVQPEDWTVRLVLRFSEADRSVSGDALARIAESAGTVTLPGGEAAEITWPTDAVDAAARDDDGPSEKPYAAAVAVQVTIPWPSRNDASAESA